MNWGLISHPYHRGGVTSWMMDFFKHARTLGESINFLVPNPKTPFISASGKLPISQILKNNIGVVSEEVDFRFELGTFQKRVSFYKNLILRNLPEGSILIPSDDEAVWRACAELSHLYVFIGVLHSDDEHYYRLAENYHQEVAGFVSVSNRIKNSVSFDKPHLVIPCGIQISKNRSFPEKENKLVFVGRIEEKQKRVSDLPKIFREILNDNPDWKLSIIGNGVDMESLREEFSNLRLNDSIEFLDWIPKEEVNQLLVEAKILIQTSNFEGMSVAVMEALAAGCQILSSQVSGVEDLENDERSHSLIALYPIGDIDKAKLAFESLRQSYHTSIPKLANTLAEEFFSIESCWKSYKHFVSNLSPQIENIPLESRAGLSSDLLALCRLLKYKITH
ncbi:glycosyltransferase family 4 protein [Algoriphagus sp. NBT04N3]|uniref:glycosyltransferase family 4 protein n=1 Tax=Algoriphagus sp. NBT04N3 TaxID=2705473 RepID=UPI001C6371A9|nr:glycosyltransferase family 4 protein [Algoriphagus sp. NBT04N3]QYH37964.1 glycosyltransferase family 4 protein [Algoriphagus sp. NBT04N3]